MNVYRFLKILYVLQIVVVGILLFFAFIEKEIILVGSMAITLLNDCFVFMYLDWIKNPDKKQLSKREIRNWLIISVLLFLLQVYIIILNYPSIEYKELLCLMIGFFNNGILFSILSIFNRFK